MNNHIQIYEKNTENIMCYVSGISDVSGYIPYLSVKYKTSDASTVLFKEGTVSDASGTFTFALTAVDTSLAPYDYVYDITIEKSPVVITVIKDRFSILDTVKF